MSYSDVYHENLSVAYAAARTYFASENNQNFKV